MKLIDSRINKEITFDEWIERDSYLRASEMTEYQNILFSIIDPRSKASFYTKLGLERVKLRIKAILETEEKPNHPKFYYSLESHMLLLLSPCRLPKLNDGLSQELMFNVPMSREIEHDKVFAYSFYFSTKCFISMKKIKNMIERGVFLLYFKGRVQPGE